MSYYDDSEIDQNEYWIYRRGFYVLYVKSVPGMFLSAKKHSEGEENDFVCKFASGQFFDYQWELRIKRILPFADTFLDFVEDLEDRGYTLDRSPPSKSKRHFRTL